MTPCTAALIIVIVLAALEVVAFGLFFRRYLPNLVGNLTATREAWETVVAAVGPLATGVDDLRGRVSDLERRAG